MLSMKESQGVDMDDRVSYEVLHKMQETLAHLINRSNRYHILSRTIKDESVLLSSSSSLSSLSSSSYSSVSSHTISQVSALLGIDVNEVSKSDEDIDIEYKRSLDELEKLKEEEKNLLKDEQEIIDQGLILNELEKGYLANLNQQQEESHQIQEEQESHLEHIKAYNARLEILKKTNIFDDAFFIWHNGEFGTINNLRLGYLPEIPVEWSEINSAWGLVALLLSSLSRHVGYTFREYRIIPMGMFTQIALAGNENAKKYPLHFNGGYFKNSYNTAMTYFLCCLKEFSDMAEATDRTFFLPYKIRQKGEYIGDLSIKYGSDHAKWTKSLKYMLTDLRWLIAFTQKQNM